MKSIKKQEKERGPVSRSGWGSKYYLNTNAVQVQAFQYHRYNIQNYLYKRMSEMFFNFWQQLNYYQNLSQIQIFQSLIPCLEKQVVNSEQTQNRRDVIILGEDKKQQEYKSITIKKQSQPKTKGQAAVRVDQQYKEERREYRRKVIPPKKKFACTVEGCSKKYGSHTALMNHERKNHEIRRRLKKGQALAEEMA